MLCCVALCCCVMSCHAMSCPVLSCVYVCMLVSIFIDLEKDSTTDLGEGTKYVCIDTYLIYLSIYVHVYIYIYMYAFI